jgi:Family of unknown function (DUF7009)
VRLNEIRLPLIVKLRLQFNSVRFRLKRREVEQLALTGRVEEKILIGSGDDETFDYVVESTAAVSSPRATVTARGIVVQVPSDEVMKWASTDQVGIEGGQPVESETSLRILVEKDFACIDGTDQENADTFPNPLAGLKC